MSPSRAAPCDSPATARPARVFIVRRLASIHGIRSSTWNVSHRDGPIFLNVIRFLDIPEALGLLAPRPLTLINAKDKAFDRTAEIYKLAGAADKFQRK